MHVRARTVVLLAALGLGAPHLLTAQVTESTASDSLAGAVARFTARFDSLESGRCPAGPTIAIPARSGNPHTDSLVVALGQLSQRLEAVRTTRCAAPAAAAQTADTTDDLAALRAAAAEAAGGAAQGPGPAAPGDSTPAPKTEFVGRQRNASALNPEISATGDVRLVAREGSQGVDAVAREFEVAFQSALDPYSNTKIILTFSDEEVGVEEGYIYWTGLPGHLRVDLGKFRQQLGDLNRWHLHALPETEYPLVYQRFLGPEGLAGVGLSLYTTLPFSLLKGTHEVWLQGATVESDPLYAGGHHPTWLFRFQNFWQLNRATYAQLGFDGTGGDNNDEDLSSRLLGLDFRLTYRPPESGTRREITLRTEGYQLYSSQFGTTTDRYGTFVDLNARLSRHWVLGGRYDWVESPRGIEDTEWRITPSIAWWESEFVLLRLEGEHAESDLKGKRNMLSLQVVWAMGPHKHETY